MALVILEGVNGTGKTTIAKILASKLKIPVYRPFRSNPDSHWAEEEKAKFDDLNIPVNSYVEDACAADALVQLGVSAVLDRSMPSAIVYARVDDAEYKPTFAHLDWWQETIRNHPSGVLFVQLVAPIGVIKERLGRHAPAPSRCNDLSLAYEKVFQRVTFPKLIVNTGDCSAADSVARILRKVSEIADA